MKQEEYEAYLREHEVQVRWFLVWPFLAICVLLAASLVGDAIYYLGRAVEWWR